MANIKLSPLLSGIRGSLGTATFQRSQGGTTLRLKPIPKDKFSLGRQLSKSYLSLVIAAWQNLSDAQRTLWNQYASFSPHYMTHARDRALNGYNLFCKYNLVRLQAGLDILQDAVFLSPDVLEVEPKLISSQGIWLAGGNGTNTLAWSFDGIAWNGLGKPVFSQSCYAICWNGSIYIAGGTGGNTLAWSVDGITWNGLGVSIFSQSCSAVCWNGSIFVAGGKGSNTLAWSADGIEWYGLGATIFESGCEGICWNGSLFVAVGAGSNHIAWSSDGIIWNGLGSTPLSLYGCCVCWNGSRFVAGGFGNSTIAWSSDGIIWNGLGSSTFDTVCFGISWNGSIFVAGGAGNNTLAWSPDGIAWNGLGHTIFDYNCFSIFWSGSIFVAGGDGFHTQAWSVDGIVWNGLGKTIFSENGYAVISSNAPTLYPPTSGNICIMDFGVDLQYYNQFALLKLSGPRRPTEGFKLNTCRIIILDIEDYNPFDILESYIAVFGSQPVFGDIVNCEITLFSLIAGKVFPPVSYRLTI